MVRAERITTTTAISQVSSFSKNNTHRDEGGTTVAARVICTSLGPRLKTIRPRNRRGGQSLDQADRPFVGMTAGIERATVRAGRLPRLVCQRWCLFLTRPADSSGHLVGAKQERVFTPNEA